MSSAEVVKKRGRPKKVVLDSVVSEKPEAPKKATTRQKSTKATSSSTTSIPAKQAKASKTSTTSSKSAIKVPDQASELQSGPTPPSSSTSGVTSNTNLPTETPAKVTATNSNILRQVQELSPQFSSDLEGSQTPKTPSSGSPLPAKPSTKPRANVQPTPAKSQLKAKASPPPTQESSITAQPKAAMPSSESRTSDKKTSASTPKPSPSSIPQKPQPASLNIPIAALNSNIVSQISTRAGARPGAKAANPLPANYKPVARRVTMTIVALPIAIVTSWVLYERLVMGQERKHLVKPNNVVLVESDESRPSDSIST